MRRTDWWLGLVMVAVLGTGGCAGIISEKYTEDGTSERVRFGTVSKWSTWDHNPTKQDETVIMLRKESTF